MRNSKLRPLGWAVILFQFLLASSVLASTQWAQPNFDWKQQRAAPFPGPRYLPYPQSSQVIQSEYNSYIVGTPANKDTVFIVQSINYEGEQYGTITAVNSTTLEILWTSQAPSRLSSYQVSNPLVTSNGSLIFGISPPSAYQQPSQGFQSIVQLSPSGELENAYQLTAGFPVNQFFLGPQDEIILSSSSNSFWYILNSQDTSVSIGTPLSCDDEGNLFVFSENRFAKTTLANPTSFEWVVCPGPYNCATETLYITNAVVSYDQNSVYVAVCADYIGSFCNLVNVNIQNGQTSWYQEFTSPIAQISAAGDFLFVGSGNVNVYSSSGSLLNSTSLSGSATFVGDSNGNIVAYSGQTLSTYTNDGVFSSQNLFYFICMNEDTQIFYTALNSIWLSCSQQLWKITLTLGSA